MNERYARHISLTEVGIEGQQKLAKAKVLVIGAGGLGCPVLKYLVAAGIGTLGIVDFDTVSLSNLQRQILYTEKDIGKNKATVAKKRLESLNKDVDITIYPEVLGLENCLTILASYDIVVDGTDNFTTRYLLNDACCKLQKPLVYGSLYKYEGQVSVFNYKEGPSYRCLFPEPPKSGEVPNCNEIGVLGVLPGQIGIMQATEVLKIILEIGEVLSGKLLYINVLTNDRRIIEIERNDKIIQSICTKKLELVATRDCITIASVSLSEMNLTDEDVCWIDVREDHEQPQLEFPGLKKIPLSSLLDEIHTIPKTTKKIIFCQSGVRAKKAIDLLVEQQISNCVALSEGANELNYWIHQ